jgi:nucleotide-binding universal stress UspA family protein
MGGTIVCDVTDALEGPSAAQFGNALAARLGLRVVLVYVIDGGVAGRTTERDADHAVAVLREELGIDAETRVALGDHAEAVARVAAEEGADAVIVGSRAVGFGGRNLRSTRARDLEAATSVPVLVAPPSTRRPSARRLAAAAQSR